VAEVRSQVRAARWYGWAQAPGLVLVAFYFARFFVPLAVSIVRWVVTGLQRNSPGQFAFWEVLVSGCVALVPAATASLTYVRDHRGRPVAAGKKVIP
jgi:hypothetical protein